MARRPRIVDVVRGLLSRRPGDIAARYAAHEAALAADRDVTHPPDGYGVTLTDDGGDTA